MVRKFIAGDDIERGCMVFGRRGSDAVLTGDKRGDVEEFLGVGSVVGMGDRSYGDVWGVDPEYLGTYE